ncbi:MAG: DNA-3-methyladenine glycosylase 2 family protein [Acidimicrobiales bacterium]
MGSPTAPNAEPTSGVASTDDHRATPYRAADDATGDHGADGAMLDHGACYEAVRRRDARFDGRFYTGVTSTGIFCRPSCPARTPRSSNVRFFLHAAAASTAGFRPCRRCRPELAPGHPEWNRRADLAGKALALIEQGVVDVEGVAGLAGRLGVSERHLRRELNEAVGTGPTQLARSRRLWLARLLLDQTNLAITDVAFASGFSSIRQFNDAFRQTFDATPTTLRRRPDTAATGATELTLSLSGRGSVQWTDLHRFLTARAIDGLELSTENRFRRGVPGGWLEIEGTEDDDRLLLRCRLDRLDQVAQLVPMVRRVADLDTDLQPVAEHLSADPDLAGRLEARRLPRLPGTFDPFELAIRAVVGQQVSVAGASTTLANLVTLAVGPPPEGTPAGEPDERGRRPGPDPDLDPDPNARSGSESVGGDRDPALHQRFPTADEIASAPLDELGMPGKRRATIRALAEAVADGRIDLSAAADRERTAAQLLDVPGIGPWTAGYVAMRALNDPDGWPVGDLVLRNSLGTDAKELERRAERWRPWRAYAALLLWNTNPRSAKNAKNNDNDNDNDRDKETPEKKQKKEELR